MTQPTSDVVVVVSGVIGASIALELARRGRTVLVVDKAGGAGHGSTSASSAIVRFAYSTYDSVAMAWDAKFGWQSWAEQLCFIDPALAAQNLTAAASAHGARFRFRTRVTALARVGKRLATRARRRNDRPRPVLPHPRATPAVAP